MRTAVFPGSFDPITRGHTDIINRALPLFDKIVIGIGNNTAKKYLYDLGQRESWIREIYRSEPKIEVVTYQKLTVELCREVGAKYILRGLRSALDFEYERPIANLNHSLEPGVETVFILASEKYASLSSTIIREVIRYGGDVSSYVPEEVSIKK